MQKKNLAIFDYSNLTIEQIERLLKEVNNQMHVDKRRLVTFLMNKKYNKILKKEKKVNDLNQMKETLWEIIGIFKEYCPEYIPGILLQILKLNKEHNIMEIKPFIEYIKNPIVDRSYGEQRNFYSNKITNTNSNALISLPNINFEELNKHKFIEELLIDFFIYKKAKPEDFNKFFKQEYLEKMEFISKMYRGEEIKAEEYNKYLKEYEYERISKKNRNNNL